MTAADEHRVAGLGRHALRRGGVGELPTVHRCAGGDVLRPAEARDVVEHAARDDALAPEVDGAAVRERHAVLVELLAVPGVVALLHREVAERVEVGLGEAVDEQRQVVAHRTRVLHRHHVARRVGVRGSRLGVDRPGARHHATVLHELGGGAAHVVGHEVEGAELVVVAPTAPIGVVGAPTVVLLGGRWCAFLDAHAQTVTPRLRSPLVAVDAGYDPFSVEVMTDPYPLYRELRVSHRVVPLPAYDAFALTRFDDVWRVLSDREQFSIHEGPVFHRQALLRHHDGPPDTTVGRPVPTFSMLDPPVHTQLRQALLGPFRPRAVTPMEDTVRQFARARLDQLVERDEFDVRHDYASPVAAQVAALQLGFPVEDAELLVDWVNAFVAREPDVAGDQRGGTGRARRAARLPRRPRRRAARHPRRRATRPHRLVVRPRRSPRGARRLRDRGAALHLVHRRVRDPAQDRGGRRVRALARARAAVRARRPSRRRDRRVRGDAPPPAAVAVRRPHPRGRHRGRGRGHARGSAGRVAAHLREPRRARVRQTPSGSTPRARSTVTSASGTVCTSASARTWRDSKASCWCRSCSLAVPSTTSSRTAWRARCPSSTWAGPGCRSVRAECGRMGVR